MSSWDYLDFELEIGEGRERKYPVAVRSPAGEAQAEMRFPFDAWELKDRLQALEIALLRSGGTRRRIASPEESTVQDFGRGLFESLLVGDVRTRYEMSLSEARRQGKGLRLKLRIQPSELAAVPWEFLYDVERDRYPSLSSNTPLVRYLDLPQPVEPLCVRPPLRVLGMVTSPSGLAALDVEHEKRLVEEATRGLREKGLLELTWLEGQTWRHLQRTMRHGPWHIFHFVGHGGFDPATEEGALALSDEAGRMNLLRARGLAELLDDHYPLRLVFLNSCEGARGSESDAFSSTAATLVRRGVPAVVAMQYEITDTAAIEFSRDFYDALADSLPVDAAVTEARAAVSMDSALEWGTPVLYMHSPDGRVFDVVASDPSAQPVPETEDQLEEDAVRRYREAVEAAWAEGTLEVGAAQMLRDRAESDDGLSPETAAGIEREVMGETIGTILGRQEQAARRQREERLSELYAHARRLHRDRKWQAVIDVFEKILAEAPNSADPEGLLASSRDALELEQRVATLYERGLRYIEAEEWRQARECFEEVRRLQPGYGDTEQLLSRTRRALAAPSTVEVPDLTGLEVTLARRTLANSGLTLGIPWDVPDDAVAEGVVSGQKPQPGTGVAAGSTISATISAAPRETTTVDPADHRPPPRTYRDGRVQRPLPQSVSSTWTLVSRGLAMGVFGLLLVAIPEHFRLYGALLITAYGLLPIIDAKTRIGRRRLLLMQGAISIVVGLCVFLVWLAADTSIVSKGVSPIASGFAQSSISDGAVKEWLAQHIQDWGIDTRLVGSWALFVGSTRILAALQLRWETKNLLLMATSGALLIVSGILFWSVFPSAQFALALLLFASGVTLVAVALGARRGRDGRVEAYPRARRP